jgi:hypothetical protein
MNKKKKIEENITNKRNEDWWRLESHESDGNQSS